MTEKVETNKAEKGNWDVDFEKKSDGGNSTGSDGKPQRKAVYMKFDGAGEYIIRLVGNHVKFLRHWAPFDFKDRVITDASYKGKDPAWNTGFWPRKTFAIHVIDRKDGQLKILEKGTQIFKEFARYKAVNDINPAGIDGPNFVITVEVPKGNKKATKYSVTAQAKAAPFTQTEIEMIKANVWALSDIYRSTPLEKIQQLWANLSDDKKIPPKKEEDADNEVKSEAKAEKPSAPAAKPVVEAVADSPADNGEDLFKDDASGDGGSNLF